MTNRNFDEWLNKFRPSISSYDYYIDFEKVIRNVDEIKVELNILNSLIASKNIEDEFEKIEAKQREWLDMGFSIDSAPLKELDKQMDGIWADIASAVTTA